MGASLSLSASRAPSPGRPAPIPAGDAADDALALSFFSFFGRSAHRSEMPRSFAANSARIRPSAHMFPSNVAARSASTGVPHRSTGAIFPGASAPTALVSAILAFASTAQLPKRDSA